MTTHYKPMTSVLLEQWGGKQALLDGLTKGCGRAMIRMSFYRDEWTDAEADEIAADTIKELGAGPTWSDPMETEDGS